MPDHGPEISKIFIVTRVLAMIVGLGCGGGALAQTERQVFLPVVFDAEGTKIRTTACLEVTERAEPQTVWWEDVGAKSDAPERAFKAVIAAIKRKDRASLATLTDSTQGEGTKDFEAQSAALFQQLEALRIVVVPKAYEVDGLLVFFAKLQFGSKSFVAPFVFAHRSDGSFGFLPARAQQLGLQLVSGWFGPNSAATESAVIPPYCDDKNIKRATHSVPLAGSAISQPWHASQLLFVGAPFDSPGPLGGIVARVRSTIDSLKSAEFGGGANDFIKHVTPEGGDQIKKWLATANDADRAKYKNSVVLQMENPVFVIDASPLFVIYTRSRSGVQVVYFTEGSDKKLLWTNNAYVTDSDKLFKHGALNEAASQNKPFSSFATR